MSFNLQQLPKRAWFGAAALMLLLAVIATCLFWPKLQPGPDGSPSQQSSTPSSPQDTQPGGPQLRQSGEQGNAIPWGGQAPGDSVRLAILGLDPDSHGKATFVLEPEIGESLHIEGSDTVHLFRSLAPARYRWSVQVAGADGSTLPLTPPRETPESFDFTVPPRTLTVSNLNEAQLNGSPIGDDLRTDNGAQLSASANALPEAVIDFEVKPAGKDFDGTALQSAPVSSNGKASLPYQDVEEDYHWRARATVPGHAPSAWVELQRTSKVDFHIVPRTADNPSGGQPPPAQLPEGVSSSSGSGSGSGPSQPLPSEPIDLPSFAALLLSPWAVGLAVLFVTLAVCRWLWARRRKALNP